MRCLEMDRVMAHPNENKARKHPELLAINSFLKVNLHKKLLILSPKIYMEMYVTQKQFCDNTIQ